METVLPGKEIMGRFSFRIRFLRVGLNRLIEIERIGSEVSVPVGRWCFTFWIL